MDSLTFDLWTVYLYSVGLSAGGMMYVHVYVHRLPVTIMAIVGSLTVAIVPLANLWLTVAYTFSSNFKPRRGRNPRNNLYALNTIRGENQPAPRK